MVLFSLRRLAGRSVARVRTVGDNHESLDLERLRYEDKITALTIPG